MRLVENIYEVRHDDGSRLEPEEEERVRRLMKVFQKARVNGEYSPVGPRAALRMAAAVLSSYDIEPLIQEHE